MWRVPIEVRAGRTAEVELTNANAYQAVDGDAPDIAVYRRIQGALVRVEAGLSRGTGVVLDSPGGLVATSDRLLGDGADVSVILDSVTRVAGSVVARDSVAGVALVAYGTGRTGRTGVTGGVLPGEQVMVAAYLAYGQLTLSTSTVTGVSADTVGTDERLGRSSIGAPAVNMRGEVVAISTGAALVPVARVEALIARARDSMATSPRPAMTRLPMLPSDLYPLAGFKAMGDTVDLERLKRVSETTVGGFDLVITTPLWAYARERADEPRGRGRRRGIRSVEDYVATRSARDWDRYVGAYRVPVVAIAVHPRLSQSSASILGQLVLGKEEVKAKLKFAGDVRGVTLYRNGDSVPALFGGHAPTAVRVDTGWVEMDDDADMGFYLFDPEVFRPDSVGVAPRIVIEVVDGKRPGKPVRRELKAEMVNRVWGEFDGYRQTTGLPLLHSIP